jgi:hypothetical protein
MMWVWLLLLAGCKTLDSSRYERCVVQVSVQKDPDNLHHWITRCTDGTIVIFPRMIDPKQEVLYTPYQENISSTTYGYIKQVHGPRPKSPKGDSP